MEVEIVMEWLDRRNLDRANMVGETGDIQGLSKNFT